MVTILNFDQVYETQLFYRTIDYEWIDLSHLKNVSRYCEPEPLAEISRRLKGRSRKGITFVGTGNYHYVSYLLLKEIVEPFTLVLFDYHTDLLPGIDGSDLISCGSWVLRSLEELLHLQQVIIVGANQELESIIPPGYTGKVRLYSRQMVRSKQNCWKDIVAAIATEAVYISIDKDVLTEDEAITNWDQGDMTLDRLLFIIRQISRHKRLLGLDVCGEYPATIADCYSRKNRVAIAKNNRANGKILAAALKIKQKETKRQSIYYGLQTVAKQLTGTEGWAELKASSKEPGSLRDHAS